MRPEAKFGGRIVRSTDTTAIEMVEEKAAAFGKKL
jgi:hypothetical protein